MSMHLAVNKTDLSTLKDDAKSLENGLAIHTFAHYFHSFIAETITQKLEVFRLRHQVYCEELKFEPIHESGLEHDEFDKRSIHVAIANYISAKLVGTVRIITTDNYQQLLPIEESFGTTIKSDKFNPANFNRAHICEISRLAVPEGVRCNVNQPNSIFASLDETCCKLVAVALYLLTSIVCQQTERHHCFVMIEPRLARGLRRIGIIFTQIGDVIDFHGLRAPHYIDTRTLDTTLKPQYLMLKDWLAEQVVEASQSTLPSKRTA